jgi:parallel beta-helix repeat protein/predicted outer membrane repeat protein
MVEITNLKKILFVSVLSAAAICRIAAGAVIYVDDDGPSDFNNIQAAIDAAGTGDTVLVANDTYTGLGNRNIDFHGKAITVRSENGYENCIIDCENSHRGFHFHSNEDSSSILDGFTIVNGYSRNGGAIDCNNSSPKIINCIIAGNTATSFGGGIYCANSVSVGIDNCQILNNSAGAGGGIYLDLSSSCYIRNCIIADNKSDLLGGGINCWDTNVFRIINCTVTNNQKAGVYLHKCSSPKMYNSIVYSNENHEIYIASTGGFLNIYYSDARASGSMYSKDMHSIFSNPHFVDADNSDITKRNYRLLPGSICINNASPSYQPAIGETDIEGQPRIMGGCLDMGADEFYPEVPIIEISPAGFDFSCPLGGPNPEQQVLSVRNDGIQPLHWQIYEDCNWLDVSPTSGRSSGEVNKVVLSVDANGLDSGQYSCMVEISDSNAINSPQYVTVNLDVRRPLIGFSPNSILFASPQGGPNPQTQVLSIWNDDIGTLNWNVNVDCNWLQVDPNQGSLTGQVNEVMLHVDVSGLITGLHNCTLTITDPTALNNPQVVPIALRVYGEAIYVPDEFSTIQDAIDYALDGGTIIVAEGTYTGHGNRDIDFKGKALTVRSKDPDDPIIVAATVIDCNGTKTEPHRGFYFHNGEEANSILAGFTITNGYVDAGGGILCEGGRPTITNCIIFGNAVGSEGGGICCRFPPPPPLPPMPPPPGGPPPGGPPLPPPPGPIPPPPPPPVQDCNLPVPTITNCFISENTSYYGGGIYYKDMKPIITNCIITNNTASDGGGIYCKGKLVTPPPPPPPPPPGPPGSGVVEEQSPIEVLSDYNPTGPMIANCTVTGNIANNAGGAVYCANYSCPVIINNCILWENRATLGSEIALVSEDSGESEATVSHCDIKGGQTSVHISDNCILYWGQGNIDSDPCFIDPVYSARISYWKFDEAGGRTAYDSVGRNHGTVHRARWTSGQVGGALDFDSIFDLVEVPDFPDLNPQFFTAEAWIKTPETSFYGTFGTILVKGRIFNENYGLFVYDSGWVRWQFTSGGVWGDTSKYVFLDSSKVVNDDQFHHIVATYDGERLQIYIDGSLDASRDETKIPDKNNLSLRIGMRNNPLDSPGRSVCSFEGIIDEVAIYNRALSADEIQQHYQNGLSGHAHSDANAPDFHLLPGSPCIDAGDSNNIPADWADLDGDGDMNEPIPFDLDGHPRVMDGDKDGISVVDMGSYEFNHVPVADAGPDQTVEAQAPWGATVTLDGSGSSDEDSTPGTNDDIVYFDWYKIDPCEPNADVFLGTAQIIDCNLSIGKHIIVLEVIDKSGAYDSNEVTIIVQDTTPPDFELSVSPTMLWPPDHKMYEITTSWTVNDECDEAPEVSLVSIVANEGDNTIGDGHTSNDIQINADGSIYLRSERSGTSGDRVYTITYQAVDDYGNTTVRSATVSIPHDFKVLARIAAQWLWAGPGRIPEDLNGDGIVNLEDFARFANNWIK